ncbi:MAG: threonine synthase [Oscillospiraceae bacterium]|nr:threonine synthase [Oscillospiraceae bacterium]
MQYQSTRDKTQKVSASEAILRGLSAEGGLFVPEQLPRLPEQRLERMVNQDYIQRAQEILGDFLSDFLPAEIESCLKSAYGSGKFSGSSIAPLAKLGEDAYLLELWHGPTCAFKDMALQLLPQLMVASAQKSGDGREIVILVATSGDTGKAALEGFCDVPGIRIIVFYPEEGVSPLQKLQMATQEGENVFVAAIQGNFDDAQTGVKRLFTAPGVIQKLKEQKRAFSSANSINWGRLLPQIVYYVSAYCDLVRDEQIVLGDPINVCVPTGNFGNILAAYYAKQMGLPIQKLICASNQNNVLTDFICTGTYDRNRPFYATTSPSMDILISSNLERLLFHLMEEDDAAVRELMESLKEKGRYTVSPQTLARLQADFDGGFCDEACTAATIKRLFDSYSYLCDTHTAVAVSVYEAYRARTGDDTKTVIASTASPFKFPHAVLSALGGETAGGDEFQIAERLAELSGCQVPGQLAGLREKTIRFTEVFSKEGMEEALEQALPNA